MAYRYKPEVLELLLTHGIRPTPATPPEKVHELLNDLYRFELRRIRDRLLRREFPKPDYHCHVAEIRRRYPLLSRKLWEWME